MGHPTLFVLRHGETTWNREGRIQGQSQSVLTVRGRDQAAQQGRILERYLAEQPGIEVYASPLLRCHQTALIALGDEFWRVVFDERLVEVGLGSWEGHLWADVVAANPDLGDDRISVFERCFAAPDGESLEALCERVGAFLEELRHPSIIITHGVAGAVLRGLVRGLDLKEIAALDHLQGCVLRLDDGAETLLLGP